MPWARLDDGYFTHRKVIELSCQAKLLDLAAIAYSARELTDGELRKRDVMVVAAAADADEPMRLVGELVKSGRWEQLTEGLWRIHDYLKYNPSREQILKERARGAERQSRFRAKDNKPPQRARKRNAVSHGGSAAGPVPEPGPVNGTRSRTRSRTPEPGDARATREGSEFENDGETAQVGGKNRASIVLVPPDENGHVRIERQPFNDDLALRIQAIGAELEDDNIASSITRAQRYQAAAHLDCGTMANAVKDAHRRTRRRIRDPDKPPVASPMAYFLGSLEQTTQERARAG